MQGEQDTVGDVFVCLIMKKKNEKNRHKQRKHPQRETNWIKKNKNKNKEE